MRSSLNSSVPARSPRVYFLSSPVMPVNITVVVVAVVGIGDIVVVEVVVVLDAVVLVSIS